MDTKLLLTTDEAAEVLHMAPRTLINMRFAGAGPRYYKVTRRVCYRLSDLEDYIGSNIKSPVELPVLDQRAIVD